MSHEGPSETLVSLFSNRVSQSGPGVALYFPRGTRPAELAANAASPPAPASSAAPAIPAAVASRFDAVTWSELAADVRRVAAALRALGVTPGDRVAQVSGNRYLWIVIDLAVHMARGVHVALHSALSGEQMAWQIRDSGSRLVIGSTDGELQSCKSSQGPLSQPIGQSSVLYLVDEKLAHVAATEARPDQTAEIEHEALTQTTPGDLATILYTSGTTGEPKGVMLSHGNLASNALAALAAFQTHEDDVRLCWLPLSHIYARTSDLYTWIARGHEMGLAHSRETLVADMAALRPTVINGVPYFYDKLRRHLIAQKSADKPGALRQLMGGRMRLCCAGGAALPDHVAEFFADQGLLLAQGYGLTESSPVISTCSPAAHRIGTVGPPVPGVEVRIADDGEILTRGPHVMLGYWNRPADTAAAIQNGWLHTGDVGRLEGGFLRITGRKKELLVLASGKKVAPTLLENRLTADPLIAQAIIVGEAKNFLAALVVLDQESLRAALAAAHPAAGQATRAAIESLVGQRIAAGLAGLSDWEQVRKFAVVDRPFSIEQDELTPTLKLRRDVILSHFAAEVERLYAGDAAACDFAG